MRVIEKTFELRGFDDDVCICDVCGKKELRGTYIVQDVSTNELFRAGSTCGAKLAGWSAQKFKKEVIKQYQKARSEACYEFYQSEEFKAYEALKKEKGELFAKYTPGHSQYEKAQIKRDEIAKKHFINSTDIYI